MSVRGLLILSVLFFTGSGDAFRGRPRIYGGTDAQIQEFPYMASLREAGYHFCGGAILSELHILTAAHCIEGKKVKAPFDHFTVHTGTSYFARAGRRHRIADVAVHPEYNDLNDDTLLWDVAIVTLADPIVFDEAQQKLNLPTKHVEAGAEAIFTGWGKISPYNSAPRILQKMEPTIISNEECMRIIKDTIFKENVCAVRDFGIGACMGDSGSPLVVNKEVVAIASWVVECAEGYPDVYLRTFPHKEYIESIMRGNYTDLKL